MHARVSKHAALRRPMQTASLNAMFPSASFLYCKTQALERRIPLRRNEIQATACFVQL